MVDTTVPHFFDEFPMRRVGSGDLDAALADAGDALSILFLWGRDCPNCDIAKRQMLATPARFAWPGVRWLQANVYDDRDIGLRFGLHGVPAFILFRGTKKLGRISPWPGTERFCDVVEPLLGA